MKDNFSFDENIHSLSARFNAKNLRKFEIFSK